MLAFSLAIANHFIAADHDGAQQSAGAGTGHSEASRLAGGVMTHIGTAYR